jgi:hypothetical protein
MFMYSIAQNLGVCRALIIIYSNGELFESMPYRAYEWILVISINARGQRAGEKGAATVKPGGARA